MGFSIGGFAQLLSSVLSIREADDVLPELRLAGLLMIGTPTTAEVVRGGKTGEHLIVQVATLFEDT